MLALIAALLQVPTGPFHGFERPAVTVAAGAITVQLAHAGEPPPPAHPVSFTTEPFSLATAGAKVADEADLFGSGLALDLDGDGATTAKIALTCVGQNAMFGLGTIVKPLGEAVWTYAPGKIVRVGAKGAYALLYGPCGRNAFVGLSREPIRVQTLPGPVLQVHTLQIVPDPKAPAAFTVGAVTVDGQPAQTAPIAARVREPLGGPQPEWAHLRGVFVALPAGAKVVQVKYTGAGDALVAAAINVAPAPNQRARGPFGFAKIGE